MEKQYYDMAIPALPALGALLLALGSRSIWT